MIGEIARGAGPDPAADPGSYAKAILNILGDFSDEKARIQDAQKATLNILADFSDERARLAGVQKAILNVLEDSAGEKAQIESTQQAVLNILEDFDTEKKKVEETNREMAKEIAKRKAAEEKVRERAAALEAVNKELEAFSYSVSHDLRAPLRAIDGFSRILEEDYDGKLDDEGRRMLSVVRGNSRKMGQLIDDLLGFSQLGRKALASAALDMRQLAEEALDEIKTDGERPPRVTLGALPGAHGDAALVKQLWVNLLSNAVKFSAGRERSLIEVSGYKDGEYNVYCVKDNGAGFDMKYYDKLFGVFQRLHREEEFEGTGVGLAIVQRVVSRHGGRVWAEGKVDEGAVFYFSLPRGKQDGQI